MAAEPERELTLLEEAIWSLREWDWSEFDALMELSEALKAEGNLCGRGWQERPATLKQVLAAGKLDPEEALWMHRGELDAFCRQFLRGDLSDQLGLY